MDDAGTVDDILSQYNVAPREWPGESTPWVHAADRRREQDIAWDRAMGDPNAGYQLRLPQSLASARGAVMDKVRSAGDALFGWMTPEQRSRAAFATNFLGPAAPMAHAMFMTPAMVTNLELAGVRGTSGPGSIAAYQSARKAWKDIPPDRLSSLPIDQPGMLDRVWATDRWLPPGVMGTTQTRPLTWIDTPFEVSPAAARHVFGEGRGVRAPFDRLFEGPGVDVISTALPIVNKVRHKMELDANPGGETSVVPQTGALHGMEFRGPNPSSIKAVAHHELEHFGPQAAMDALRRSRLDPVKVPADAIYRRALNDARRKGAPAAEIDRLMAKRDKSREYAAYANQWIERMAREGTLREADPSLSAVRPGLLDTFTPEAFVAPRAGPDPSMPELTYQNFKPRRP